MNCYTKFDSVLGTFPKKNHGENGSYIFSGLKWISAIVISWNIVQDNETSISNMMIMMIRKTVSRYYRDNIKQWWQQHFIYTTLRFYTNDGKHHNLAATTIKSNSNKKHQHFTPNTNNI